MIEFYEWVKLKETGFGPYIGPCVNNQNFIVQGACSDQLTDKQIKKARAGEDLHKKTVFTRKKIPKA